MDVLKQDILRYLCDDAIRKLGRIRSAEAGRLNAVLHAIRNETRTADDAAFHALFVRCHLAYGELGGVLTAAHWQSPAIDASVADEAGDERGTIVANLNDYKRDMHAAAVSWEKSFASVYLAHPLTVPPVVYATGSGMAALTTAALTVSDALPEDGKVAVGKHSYFENKELLSRIFPGERLVYFEERDPGALAAIAPHAVFADLLANDPDMTAVDLRGLLSACGRLRHRVTVVADVTCLSALRVSRVRLPKRVALMLFESLNKFHQFGLDRVTGGVVWAYGMPADALYRTRDHAGLIISETSAATLPTPNRALFKRYLTRLTGNAAYLSEKLTAACAEKGITVCHAKDGAFVSIVIRQPHWRTYRRMLTRIMTLAKRRKVPLVYGTSFGLPITRIYTWVPRSRHEKVFLRIAPGLETGAELHRVLQVIADGCVR